MAPPELSARLRFLNESAHLLVLTAPETSRHLMLKCNALMFDNNLEPTDDQKRKACGACGTIMVLGWESTLKIEKRSKKSRKEEKPSKTDTSARTMVYTCKTCDKKTSFPIDRSARPARNKGMFTRVKKQVVPPKVETAPSGAINAGVQEKGNGKKRKKGKNGGLEALLAQRKAVETKGSGFDLMDFMRKA